MRAHAPPDLRVLGDRPGAVEERDVVLPRLPAAVRVGDPAAREHAREDLGARGVQAGVDAFDERRARREREHLGQEVAQRVVHGDRAVGAGDPDVHVQAERVVAPDDVAEELVVSPVVRRVDDPLVLPAAPRVRAGRAERELLLARERVDLRAALLHLRRRLLEAVAAAGADLDLGCDQLADDVVGEVGAIGGRLQLLEAVRQLERVSGRASANSSSTATVRSVPDIELGAVAREQLLPRALLFVAHRRERSRVERLDGGDQPRATPAHDHRSTTARRAACEARRDPRARARAARCSFAAQVVGVAGLERREVLEARAGTPLRARRRPRRGPSGARRAAASRPPRLPRRPCRTPRGRSTARPSRRRAGAAARGDGARAAR